MKFDFEKTMKQMSDAELIKITTSDRHDYQEAAILAAEHELSTRKLSQEQISVANALNEQQQAIAYAKANAPLEVQWKILAIIFPVVYQFIVSGMLKGNGYYRKSKELTKWTIIGIVFYVLLILGLSAFG